MQDTGRQKNYLTEQYILAALMAAATILSWLWLWLMPMESHAAGHGGGHGNPALTGMGSLFIMWLVMMVAMMLPIVFPWAMAFSRTSMQKYEGPDKKPAAFKTSGFLAGYFSIWILFSIAGAAGQWLLREKAGISAESGMAGSLSGIVIMIVTGLYQWSPLKASCLKHCRSPLLFFLTSWKEGKSGAFIMGFKHGLFCLGCCWALMTLTFFFGVMSLGWMAIITLLLIIEKMTPAGNHASRVSGAAMVAYGLYLLIRALSL